jgi:hypothetical protein
MNIPQTSYTMYFTSALLGMQAYATEQLDKISRIASGIIYYGRAVVQSRLYAKVCRMPRSNKVVITDDGGTFTAGSLVSVITLGTLANGEVAAASDAAVTVTTAWATDKNTSLTNHAANIKAALADCYSCTYASGTHTITYIGDCKDIISCATSVTGITGTMTISSETITSADVAADVLGLSYLTHNRQQQIGGVTYYADTEPVNIARSGTIWVQAEEAVGPASTVYVRNIVNSTKYAGYFGASSDSSKCVTLAGAKFRDSVAAAGLVPLTINLPQ